VKNRFEYHIHYWIGLESTIDETGAVAYKTVELEEKLGGGAPQYREIQGNEVRRRRTRLEREGK
jgi:gelsolin